MRIVAQRVRRASVTVDGREAASIGRGIVALVGFSSQEPDPSASMARLARKLTQLRCFADDADRMNRSVQDVQGELLLIPQITLTASLEKGTRPSFQTAADPDAAKTLFDAFAAALRDVYPHVRTGVFQAHMVVALENDGPVTFVLDG